MALAYLFALKGNTMKKCIRFMAAAAVLLTSVSVLAHGPLSAPKFGGIVTEVNDIEYEFVAKPDSIAIYVENHHKKVDTKGATAKVTMLTGVEKSEVELAPAGENKLEAKGAFKVAAGTKAVIIVIMPSKPVATIRVVVK